MTTVAGFTAASFQVHFRSFPPNNEASADIRLVVAR